MHEGSCASLKRMKLDVERVGKGSECGVLLEGFDVRMLSSLPVFPSSVFLFGRCAIVRLDMHGKPMPQT